MIGDSLSSLRRLASVVLSAATLRGQFDVPMSLEDGDGIGWTLCGERLVTGVGRVTFECPWDPDFELCSVCVPTDAGADALDLVLNDLGLTRESVVQLF